MLRHFIAKSKPRIFLGELSVAKRTGPKTIDEWGVVECEGLSISLKQRLIALIPLPSVSTLVEPKQDDLVLDVIIPKYQSGDYWGFELGDVGFPIFWRPKVQIRSRLFSPVTGETKVEFSTIEKMNWREFIPRLFTWRALSRLRPVFDAADLDGLLDGACQKMLKEMNVVL